MHEALSEPEAVATWSVCIKILLRKPVVFSQSDPVATASGADAV
jgi:hypothetical protein